MRVCDLRSDDHDFSHAAAVIRVDVVDGGPSNSGRRNAGRPVCDNWPAAQISARVQIAKMQADRANIQRSP
jgi:hypothetical protein